MKLSHYLKEDDNRNHWIRLLSILRIFRSINRYRLELKCIDKYFEASITLCDLIKDSNYLVIKEIYKSIEVRINEGEIITEKEYSEVPKLYNSRCYNYDDIDESISSDDLRFIGMEVEDIMKLLWKGSPDIWNNYQN